MFSGAKSCPGSRTDAATNEGDGGFGVDRASLRPHRWIYRPYKVGFTWFGLVEQRYADYWICVDCLAQTDENPAKRRA